MKYKTIRLTEPTHRRLKVISAKRGLDITIVLDSIVQNYLQKAKA